MTNESTNPPINKGCGGALPAKSRINTFDPEWTDVFHELNNLTQRTSLIQEIMGTEVSDQRIKEAGNRYFDEIGDKAKRPRGKPKKQTASAFLKKEEDRKECAYLLGLYFGNERAGSQGPGSDFQYYPRALRLIESYKRYLSDISDSGDDSKPRVSFETFYLILDALAKGEVKRYKCHHCSSLSVVTLSQPIKSKCAVCEKSFDVDAAKEKLAQRLKIRFEEQYGSSDKVQQVNL